MSPPGTDILRLALPPHERRGQREDDKPGAGHSMNGCSAKHVRVSAPTKCSPPVMLRNCQKADGDNVPIAVVSSRSNIRPQIQLINQLIGAGEEHFSVQVSTGRRRRQPL